MNETCPNCKEELNKNAMLKKELELNKAKKKDKKKTGVASKSGSDVQNRRRAALNLRNSSQGLEQNQQQVSGIQINNQQTPTNLTVSQPPII